MLKLHTTYRKGCHKTEFKNKPFGFGFLCFFCVIDYYRDACFFYNPPLISQLSYILHQIYSNIGVNSNSDCNIIGQNACYFFKLVMQ